MFHKSRTQEEAEQYKWKRGRERYKKDEKEQHRKKNVAGSIKVERGGGGCKRVDEEQKEKESKGGCRGSREERKEVK